MNDRIETRYDERVRALVQGAGYLATYRTEGRTTDGIDGLWERRQIMFHP